MHRARAALGPAPFAQPAPAAGRGHWRQNKRRQAPIIPSRRHWRGAWSLGGLLIRPKGGSSPLQAGITPTEKV